MSFFNFDFAKLLKSNDVREAFQDMLEDLWMKHRVKIFAAIEEVAEKVLAKMLKAKSVQIIVTPLDPEIATTAMAVETKAA